MHEAPPYPHRKTKAPTYGYEMVASITRDYFDQCDDYIAIDWRRGDIQGTAIGELNGWEWDLGSWRIRIELANPGRGSGFVLLALHEIEELRTGEDPEQCERIIWTTATDAAAKAGVRKET